MPRMNAGSGTSAPRLQITGSRIMAAMSTGLSGLHLGQPRFVQGRPDRPRAGRPRRGNRLRVSLSPMLFGPSVLP